MPHLTSAKDVNVYAHVSAHNPVREEKVSKVSGGIYLKMKAVKYLLNVARLLYYVMH
jgi:hypothetical protein